MDGWWGKNKISARIWPQTQDTMRNEEVSIDSIDLNTSPLRKIADTARPPILNRLKFWMTHKAQPKLGLFPTLMNLLNFIGFKTILA